MAQPNKPGYWVETERVRPVISRWMDNYIGDHKSEHGGFGIGGQSLSAAGPYKSLANQTGVNERQLYRVMSCEAKYTSIDKLDKILCGLDLVHLFHLPPEQGGFSDVYFHPAIMEMAA